MVSRLFKASIMARRERAFSVREGTFKMGIFSGYKTFAVAVFILFAGLMEGIFGIDLPYVNVGDDWIAWVLAGLGLGSVRDAIRKLMDMYAGN